MEVYMHLLECVEAYTKEIKQNPYIYSIQKEGIDIFCKYITHNGLDIRTEDFDRHMLNRLLLFWLPRNKKYLSEIEIYQIIYTIHDIYHYIKGESKTEELPTILESYGQEYMRVYKARNMLMKLTRDPVISVDPIVIAIEKYKEKRKKARYTDIATTYEQAIFSVEACKEGGQVCLVKQGQNKQYKLLLEYPIYKYLKKGDILHAVLKRKLFYVYWEIDELKAYYLPDAIEFFNGGNHNGLLT